MNNISQAHFIRQYNEKHREDFNPDLFNRDEYEIIEALKKIILSCQRDKYFTIRVDSFEVVEDYGKIADILYAHEQEKIDRNKNNSSKIENPYQFIDLKDSDIMLLIINYYIAVNDGEENPSDTLQVILEIPRVVDKYYYRIAGSYYSAMYQIVDGSTYNNSTSNNSKYSSVVFKTVFMPTRLYRNNYEINDYNGRQVKYTMYSSRIFKKNIPVILYFLGKFGLYGTLDFFGLKHITITDFYVGDPDTVTFEKRGIFIEVPKYIFDNDIPTQCVVMSIYKSIIRSATISSIKTEKYWLEILSTHFTSKPFIEKGYALLDSLESIYDIDTYEFTRLPEDQKATIYHILRWMVREFPTLRLKDNIDISTKRIRRAEYMAAIYAMKVSKGIYRAADIQKKVTVNEIKRYIYVEPSFLISRIVKDKLSGYRNGVNDNDAMVALKYSYKGISGLGEQRGTRIPNKYRHVHHSHIGRIDLDASSASDPGITGVLCPLAKTFNQSFSDYQEPNTWDEDFSQLMEEYKETVGTRELIKFHEELEDVFGEIIGSKDKAIEIENLDSRIAQQRVALDSMITVDNSTEYFDGQVSEDGDTVILYKK